MREPGGEGPPPPLQASLESRLRRDASCSAGLRSGSRSASSAWDAIATAFGLDSTDASLRSPRSTKCSQHSGETLGRHVRASRAACLRSPRAARSTPRCPLLTSCCGLVLYAFGLHFADVHRSRLLRCGLVFYAFGLHFAIDIHLCRDRCCKMLG